MFKSDTLGKMLETNYQTQNDNGIKKKKQVNHSVIQKRRSK